MRATGKGEMLKAKGNCIHFAFSISPFDFLSPSPQPSPAGESFAMECSLAGEGARFRSLLPAIILPCRSAAFGEKVRMRAKGI
jgi:hypothetical protein